MGHLFLHGSLVVPVMNTVSTEGRESRPRTARRRREEGEHTGSIRPLSAIAQGGGPRDASAAECDRIDDRGRLESFAATSTSRIQCLIARRAIRPSAKMSTRGPLAQLGERRVRNAEVVGSSPMRSTT